MFVCACVDVKVDGTRFKLPMFELPLYIYSLCTSLYLELEVKLRSHSSAAATYQLVCKSGTSVAIMHLIHRSKTLGTSFPLFPGRPVGPLLPGTPGSPFGPCSPYQSSK